MKDGRFLLPSVGIDLVEYTRARALLVSAGPRLRRVLTKREWTAVSSNPRPERVLARILAGKEAAFKSSGKFWMGPDGFRKIRVPVRRTSYKHTARYVIATCAGT